MAIESIYLGFCETEGWIKIGRSKKPIKRMYEIRNMNPTFCIIKTFLVEDSFSIERDLHKMFDKQRITGEWFELSRKDIETIFAFMGEDFDQDTINTFCVATGVK